MRALNFEPHDWHQAQLLLAHGRTGNWETAVKLLQNIPKPEISCYNAAIGACVRCGAWQRAQDLFQELKQSGVELVALTYRAVIEGAEDAGSTDVIACLLFFLANIIVSSLLLADVRCWCSSVLIMY
jgi:pentatricopeptide repeat protein